ncbi:MAG: DUF2589 domain-containing protein [Mucinivorans sp.]
MSKDKNERVSSQVMELKELIAGPLVATIDADSLSAQRYLDYLFKIAFESYDPTTGETGALRMLTFNYRSRDLSGYHTQSVSIPILTLVPLPLLQVQEADFDFVIQVLDASSRQQSSSFSFATGQHEATAEDSARNDTRLRVALAATSAAGQADRSESRQNSMNTNMTVHVKMRQADIPGGLSTLLNKAVNSMVSDVSLSRDTPPEPSEVEH